MNTTNKRRCAAHNVIKLRFFKKNTRPMDGYFLFKEFSLQQTANWKFPFSIESNFNIFNPYYFFADQQQNPSH